MLTFLTYVAYRTYLSKLERFGESQDPLINLSLNQFVQADIIHMLDKICQF